jgi:hypothetical protein
MEGLQLVQSFEVVLIIVVVPHLLQLSVEVTKLSRGMVELLLVQFTAAGFVVFDEHASVFNHFLQLGHAEFVVVLDGLKSGLVVSEHVLTMLDETFLEGPGLLGGSHSKSGEKECNRELHGIYYTEKIKSIVGEGWE